MHFFPLLSLPSWAGLQCSQHAGGGKWALINSMQRGESLFQVWIFSNSFPNVGKIYTEKGEDDCVSNYPLCLLETWGFSFPPLRGMFGRAPLSPACCSCYDHQHSTREMLTKAKLKSNEVQVGFYSSGGRSKAWEFSLKLL